MKWIKASERLPKQATSKEFFVKYKGWPYTCKCIAYKFVFREGTFSGNNILGKEEYENIEWLDESEQPSTDGWIEVSNQLPELTEPLMWYNDEGQREVGIENYQATVLGFHPDIGLFKALLTRATGWSEISSISDKGITPTHWQPLPPLPKSTNP